MILTEKNVRVPGKMYKVQIECATTRRLTTIEWLVLTCANRFHENPIMSQAHVKQVYDEVFHLQSSEFLIKPCIKSLRELGVIQVNLEYYTYADLLFSHIHLTDHGRMMLSEGLIPGERHQIPLDIYYNPLTGKMTSFDSKSAKTNDYIDIGDATDFHFSLPVQEIMNNLQTGKVGGNKFIASKNRIESVEELTSMDWECYTPIVVEVDENGLLSTTPEMIAGDVNKYISAILKPRELSDTNISKLTSISSVQIAAVIGSGEKIKNAISAVCKNSRVLFVDSTVYELYKRNTSFFRDKIVVLFNSNENSVGRQDSTIFIRITDSFVVSGCIVLNEKNEHVSLVRANSIYAEQEIVIPIAIEDKRFQKKKTDVLKWFEDCINALWKKNSSLLAVYTLSFMKAGQQSCIKDISSFMKEWSIDQMISEIQAIGLACKEMGEGYLDFGILLPVFLEKLNQSSDVKKLTSAKKLIETGCIAKDSKEYESFVMEIVNTIPKPETYSMLLQIIECLGINSQEIALFVSEIIQPLYSKEIVIDIINTIAVGHFKRMPELFRYDTFFNEYYDCLERVKLLVDVKDIFGSTNYEKLHASIVNCPDLASLRSYLSQILEKHALLVHDGININSILHSINTEKADYFYSNIHAVEECLNNTINGVMERMSMETPIKGKVYIIDTCALIHQPDIFDYFKEDEYVRIPAQVIDELGKLKDYHSNSSFDLSKKEASNTARKLVHEINRYLTVMNENNPLRLTIENSHSDLIPAGLDANVPDNLILSVAMAYRSAEPILVSDDNQFKLAALGQNINSMSAKEFVESHKNNYKKVVQVDSKATSIKKVFITTPDGTNSVSLEKHRLGNVRNDLLGKDMDEEPLSAIRAIIPDLDSKAIEFLVSKKIRTVGQFKTLTVQTAGNLPVKGRQIVQRNAVVRAVEKFTQMVDGVNVTTEESTSL